MRDKAERTIDSSTGPSDLSSYFGTPAANVFHFAASHTSFEELADYALLRAIASVVGPISLDARYIVLNPQAGATTLNVRERSAHVTPQETSTTPQQRLQAPTLQIPAWRTRLELAVRNSQWIAALADDWDGEGAPAITQTTWMRAVHTLRRLAQRAEELGAEIPAPRIAPNGQGSVDLFWDLGTKSLLVNVPSDADTAASYSIVAAGELVSSGNIDRAAALDEIVSGFFSRYVFVADRRDP
jgi:hypothetical protein